MTIKSLNEVEIEKYKYNIINLLKYSYSISFPDNNINDDYYSNKIEKLINFKKDGNTYINALFVENKVVGFIWFFTKNNVKPNIVHINHFVVDKKHQGKKYGQILFNSVKDFPFENKIDKMELIVSSTNKIALDFYIKNGFIQSRIILEKEI